MQDFMEKWLGKMQNNTIDQQNVFSDKLNISVKTKGMICSFFVYITAPLTSIWDAYLGKRWRVSGFGPHPHVMLWFISVPPGWFGVGRNGGVDDTTPRLHLAPVVATVTTGCTSGNL